MEVEDDWRREVTGAGRYFGRRIIGGGGLEEDETQEGEEEEGALQEEDQEAYQEEVKVEFEDDWRREITGAGRSLDIRITGEEELAEE